LEQKHEKATENNLTFTKAFKRFLDFSLFGSRFSTLSQETLMWNQKLHLFE